MKSPHVIWSAAAIIIALLAAAVILSLKGKDPLILGLIVSSAAVPLLAALGFGLYNKVEQVKDLANGQTARQNDMIAEKDARIAELTEQVKQLALQLPPAEP